MSIRDDVKAYLDGELSPERAAEVRDAIESDPQLREDVVFMERLGTSLKSLVTGPQATGAAKAIDATKGRMRWLTNPYAFAAVAGSLLFVVLTIYAFPVYSQSKESARRTTLLSARPREEAGEASAEAKHAEGPLAGTTLSKNKWEFTPGGGGAGKGGGSYGEQLPTDVAKSRSTETPSFQRQVVRTGTLTVKVANVEEAERQVTNKVRSWRGYVENTESSDLESEHPTMTMVVRMPEDRFDDAMREFEKLGIRTSKTISGEDVTAQIVDMQARLKNLRAQEETYRQILRQTRRVGEVLQVQQEISRIRGEIESMDAEMQSLKKLAALSTITLTLEQRPAGKPAEDHDSGWAADAWANATGALGTAFKAISTAAIWMFVYSPIWLPIVIVLWLVTKRLMR